MKGIMLVVLLVVILVLLLIYLGIVKNWCDGEKSEQKHELIVQGFKATEEWEAGEDQKDKMEDGAGQIVGENTVLEQNGTGLLKQNRIIKIG